mgnify:CR=1 FL=1
MKSQHINFTEKAIAALPIPAKEQGQAIYYDSGSTDGLMLIVTYGGTKTYYHYMFFNKRPVRTKIGRSSQIKLAVARARAHTMAENATKGIDPGEKRRENLHDITFKQFYETIYRPEYSIVYKKPRSDVNDDSIFTHHLKDFHNRMMLGIKPVEIAKLHNNTKQTHSPYTANRVLSLIKHIYVIAAKHGYMNGHANPAADIIKFKEQTRDRFLHSDELQRLFAALETEQNEVFKNYILISLYSGQRRSSILSLRWSQVDLVNGFIYLPDTKNGEPMQVPMTNQLKELFEKINHNKNSDWVLPSVRSKSGHLEDPKRPWHELLRRAGIKNLRLHDLRRTMGSYQAISGASLHIIGKSLGHKSASATQVYARLTADPVRNAMQKATDKMMELVDNK